ncbi:MAG: ankyrin repeat domain-containing protein [Gammaproteobacteria bacterium]
MKTTYCSEGIASVESDLEGQKIVDFLLDQGIDPNIEIDGWGPLHYASFHGMPRVVKSLLSAGANINQRCSCSSYGDGGWNPLLLLLRNFDNSTLSHNNTLIEEAFNLLLEHGADVNAVTNEGTTVPGKTALDILAARPGNAQSDLGERSQKNRAEKLKCLF